MGSLGFKKDELKNILKKYVKPETQNLVDIALKGGGTKRGQNANIKVRYKNANLNTDVSNSNAGSKINNVKVGLGLGDGWFVDGSRTSGNMGTPVYKFGVNYRY